MGAKRAYDRGTMKNFFQDLTAPILWLIVAIFILLAIQFSSNLLRACHLDSRAAEYLDRSASTDK
jgi:hypothetical protein